MKENGKVFLVINLSGLIVFLGMGLEGQNNMDLNVAPPLGKYTFPFFTPFGVIVPKFKFPSAVT
jgi:hypothetical protein